MLSKSLTTRTPWQVTRSVWYALFLREAIARTTADRFAWFWMLAEPIAMVAVMVAMRAVIMSDQHIAGVDFIPWLITGLFGFFLFRENMMRSLGAVDANKGLFAYRQVKPIDPVLVRCYLEGILKSFIFIMFIIAGLLLELKLVPADPLRALFDWTALWLLGIGAGLTLSALSSMVPEVAHVTRISAMPLMLMSGAMLPLNYLPFQMQQYLLWNPIVHGIEILRSSFFPAYQPLQGVSSTYFWFWTLSLITLGLLLHLRFEQRLKAQ